MVARRIRVDYKEAATGKCDKGLLWKERARQSNPYGEMVSWIWRRATTAFAEEAVETAAEETVSAVEMVAWRSVSDDKGATVTAEAAK